MSSLCSKSKFSAGIAGWKLNRSAFCIVVAVVKTTNLWFTEVLKLTYPSKDVCGLTVVIMWSRFLFHLSLDCVGQLYASVSQSVFRQLSSLWQYRPVHCAVLILRGNVSWPTDPTFTFRSQSKGARMASRRSARVPLEVHRDAILLVLHLYQYSRSDQLLFVVNSRECLIPTVQVAMHNSEGLISSCRLSRFNASISYCSILVNFFREATSLL